MQYRTANKFFAYNPETGICVWRCVSGRSRIAVGKEVGTIKTDGRRSVKFRGRHFLVHRLAWLLTYKQWPKFDIDHINGDVLDNRISNLRDVSRYENMRNMRCHRLGKVPGVRKRWGTKPYHVQVTVNSKTIHLGCFKTEKEASDAFLKFRGDKYGLEK